MNTKRNRPGGLGLLVLLGLAVLLGPGRALAQEGSPATPPPRTGTTAAPAREPVVRADAVRLPSGVLATVVELPALADAYIASAHPNENYGLGALFLGYSLDAGFGAERMLLRFDLSSVPSNAVIEDARLRLYLIYASPGDDAAMGTIVRRLASSWDETAVTWNTEPTWAMIRDESSVGVTPGWYEWAIPDLTESWVQDSLANQGVEIEGDENVQQRERAFYSRETTTDFYPRLVVTYTVVDDVLPPIVTIDPLPAYSGRDFDVTWSGSDQGTAGLDRYDVQVQVDGGAWTAWQTGVVITSATYVGGLDGHSYAFRARGVDNVGNTEAYGAAEAETLVDIHPPLAAVDPLPALVGSDPFTITWSGSDSASGIQYYDVRYRFNGGSWLLWQNQTLAASAPFTAMVDGFYEFEARAVDNAGRVEPFEGQTEASAMRDVDAPFIVPQLWLPIINR